MRRGNSRAGSALIEFAGSLILLSAMFAGIFQAGYTFFTYSSLVNAVRAGARYASIGPHTDTAVRNLVVYGDPAPAANAKPLAPGLNPAHVELILSPATATVSLRGFEIDALFSKVKLDGRPSVTFPIAGGEKQ